MTTTPGSAARDGDARPPSVDSLARLLAETHDLPHALLVDCARRAVLEDPAHADLSAHLFARELEATLVVDVINATGVMLHTNLGRAPLQFSSTGRPYNIEFDLSSGKRGSRHDGIAAYVRALTGAEDAIVVNNNSAAVMLVVAALAHGRGVAVSRGESVEIGGGFRIPDVMEQSGARLVDVGTTNRTRLDDYARAVAAPGNDIALTMKIHPSNFEIRGFTETTSVAELATLGVPVAVDIGSGLIDNSCPWLFPHVDRLPQFLLNEPGARQSITEGADIITFSGDKLLGGPQCGVIAGRADLVAACAGHPLMRALRPGGHTILLLQEVLRRYVERQVCETVPFWEMYVKKTHELRHRAETIVRSAGMGRAVASKAVIGAGSAPGASIDSFAVEVDGDITRRLRAEDTPIIARVEAGRTLLDMRTVHWYDDQFIIHALRAAR